MANNKILFGEEVLLDLTGDTVTPDTLAEGYTAHDRSGEAIVGVMTPNKPVDVASNDAMTAIAAKATESDLGKVYLFVGEDDGVYEKDALYILIEKGSGYGFQRYAIGGSGEESTPLQEKSVEITENGVTSILPDEGYGLSAVHVTTSVPSEPIPISVSTATEMDSILSSATDVDLGKTYIYTGESTDTYEQGALYMITKEE